MRPVLAAVFCVALRAPAAGADVLVLQDGRIFDGVRLERGSEGLVIHYEHGDVRVPTDLVLDALIEDQPLWEPQTEEEREKAEKGLVPFEGKWIPKAQRERLISKRSEEKRAAIEDLKAHRLWRNRHIEATTHFEFQFTVPEHIMAPLREKMEAYFDVFAKDWKVKQPRELGRLPVCFYNDRAYFEQVSGVRGGVIGYFRFVKPLDLNFFYDRLDPELTEEVMYHETNHYLQKLIDVDFSYPHFPGESLAEYYGASAYDPGAKRFSTGLILEGRLAEVQQDLLNGETKGLRELVSADRMYEHYTWGWTLVHFLMNDTTYAKRFQAFVRALPHGKDVQREFMGVENLRTVRGAEVLRVFMDELGLKDDADLAELEAEWHDYVKNQLDFVSHRGLEKAAVSASRAGMPIKAKRLFQEAIDAGSESALTYHRYAELLQGEGERARAAELWRKAIELDPLEAEYYWSLGEALYRQGQREEGARLLRLAQEIDPEAAFWSFDPDLLKELEGSAEGD